MHILQTDILSNVTLQLILDSKPLWKWTTHSTQLCFIFTSMVKTKTLLSIKTALEKIWLGMYTYSNCFKRAKDSKNIQQSSNMYTIQVLFLSPSVVFSLQKFSLKKKKERKNTFPRHLLPQINIFSFLILWTALHFVLCSLKNR